MPESSREKEIQRRLLDWYKRNQRKLPWRRTKDPYAIWVSEIMLQQTRVETAIPYYERFLLLFPTIASLAGAEDNELLKAWEGLGYYGRARRLKKAARKVMEDHRGRLPQSVAELKALPGIGPYTAGAIASIAFGLDEPVLDGNVTRVLSRLYAVKGDPQQARTRDRLWFLARDLIPRGKAGLFNQALMDLGATICIPNNPPCLACPVSSCCAAFEAGDQDQLPFKRRKTPLPHHDVGVAVILRGKRVLIAKRPAEGLLGGLWEFPGGKREDNEEMEACVIREAQEELGIQIQIVEPLPIVRHAYTHFRVTLHPHICRHTKGTPRPKASTECRWVALEDLDEFPFPRGSLKIIQALREESGRMSID